MKLKRFSDNGFTLVEVSIAVALISFGLIMLIGAMQTALFALHDSTQQTMDAQILQQISSNITASSDLKNSSSTLRQSFSAVNSSTLYFDASGQLLSSSSGARYMAVLQDAAPSMPGLQSSDETSLMTSIKMVKISISRVDIVNSTPTVYSIQIAYH